MFAKFLVDMTFLSSAEPNIAGQGFPKKSIMSANN